MHLWLLRITSLCSVSATCIFGLETATRDLEGHS